MQALTHHQGMLFLQEAVLRSNGGTVNGCTSITERMTTAPVDEETNPHKGDMPVERHLQQYRKKEATKVASSLWPLAACCLTLCWHSLCQCRCRRRAIVENSAR